MVCHKGASGSSCATRGRGQGGVAREEGFAGVVRAACGGEDGGEVTWNGDCWNSCTGGRSKRMRRVLGQTADGFRFLWRHDRRQERPMHPRHSAYTASRGSPIKGTADARKDICLGGGCAGKAGGRAGTCRAAAAGSAAASAIQARRRRRAGHRRRPTAATAARRRGVRGRAPRRSTVAPARRVRHGRRARCASRRHHTTQWPQAAARLPRCAGALPLRPRPRQGRRRQ